MKKVKFYLGTGFADCSHEEIMQYEDDMPDEVIEEDFKFWKNDRLDAQWWEIGGED